MNNLYLCGHTGSKNRGCEAIIRSTAKIMRMAGVENISVCTFDEAFDRHVGLGKVAEILPYPSRTFFEKVSAMIRRKAFGDWTSGFACFHRDIFKNAKKGSVLFNVGGDTYCSNVPPYLSYAMNVCAEKKGVPTVFWGCTVDDKLFSSKEMQEDIRRYSYVIVRDSRTEERVKKIRSEGVIKTCDPAFWLDIKETELPRGFSENNTLGINLSSLVKNEIVVENVKALVDFALEKTDMSVCLIPHVCVEGSDNDDFAVLSEIYENYRDNDRVSLVGRDLGCRELKYIISKCRFFVGARTHSTIAAYSTGVPTMVLSYSEKSVGIACDLFGTSEGYAVNWQSLSEKNELRDLFVKTLYEHEEDLKKRYEEFLPAYKQTVVDAAKLLAEAL